MVYKIRRVFLDDRCNVVRPAKRTSTYVTPDEMVLGGLYLLMNQWYRVEREM